jgi:hypothetical protein
MMVMAVVTTSPSLFSLYMMAMVMVTVIMIMAMIVMMLGIV